MEVIRIYLNFYFEGCPHNCVVVEDGDAETALSRKLRPEVEAVVSLVRQCALDTESKRYPHLLRLIKEMVAQHPNDLIETGVVQKAWEAGNIYLHIALVLCIT